MPVIKVQRRTLEAKIFTATMADIVFVLISFFLLTYKAEVDLTQVELPRTQIRKEIPKEAALISIDQQGQTRVTNGREMSHPVYSDEEIVSFASLVVSEEPNKEFIVKADGDAAYEHVDKVLDALKRSRAKVIFLLSDQETVQ